MAAVSSVPPGAPAPAPGPPGAPPGRPSGTPAAPRPSLPTPSRRPLAVTPTHRSRGPLFWLVAGSFGCLTVAGLILGLVYLTLVAPVKGAMGVVKQQLDEIGKGDLAKAHGRLQAEYRTRVSLTAFERFVAAHPSLSNNVDVLLWPPSGSPRVERNRAYLNGVLVAVSGVREQVAYELVREGDWKISTIRVEGKEPEVEPPASPPEPALPEPETTAAPTAPAFAPPE